MNTTTTDTYNLTDYLTDFASDTHDKYIIKAAWSLVLGNSTWLDCFCDGCKAVCYRPEVPHSLAGPGLPAENTCPVDDDPLDPRCPRFDLLFEDAAVLRDAEELMEMERPEEGCEAA